MRKFRRAALAVMGVVLAAGCGIAEQTTDQLKDRDVNRDGLITKCEGLGLERCAATPGCRPIRSTGGDGATRACEHDGAGGCKQAVDYFSCVEVAPPPCGYLGRQECAADARCELVEAVCTQECRPDANGGCLPCNAPFYCAPKPPPPQNPCEGLTVSRCALDARCDVASVYQCSGGSAADPATSTSEARSVQPEYCVEKQVCVPHEPHEPKVCEGLPIGVCMTTPGCAIEIPAACKMACFLPEGCPDCVNPTPRCVPMDRPVPPAERCEQLPVAVCEANPACEVQDGPVCMIACFLPEGCPPCATPRKFCAPKAPMPPPERCEQLPVELCRSNPACEVLQTPVCEIACTPGRPCPDCATPREYCAPRPPVPPPHCVELTTAACSRVPGCEVRTEMVCTMECADDPSRPAYCHPGTCFPLEACFPLDSLPPVQGQDGGAGPLPVPGQDGGAGPKPVGWCGTDGFAP
jgi:hypothetical protein